MRKERFDDNEVYHIYNRGVEKRKIFLGSLDYQRFTDCLLLFNDIRPKQYRDINLEYAKGLESNNQFVDIFAFCLMPNHFHLLLKQKRDGGITNFIQKLCTGYTMYFNKKNERVGPLFQNRFKAVRIKTDEHLFCIPHYIHANPLEFLVENYRKLKPPAIAEKLLTYRWSSLSDFVGEKRFQDIISDDFLKEFFSDHAKYKIEFLDWLKNMRVDKLEEIAIDLPKFD